MLYQTIKKRFLLGIVNHILPGTRFFGAKRALMRLAGYHIGEDTRVVGPVFCTGDLRIGEHCWIGRGLTVHGNGTVEIGDRCDLAPEVAFLTGGHAIGTEGRRAGTGQTYRITVGSGVWIGARATILGDVSVGSGAVIAACACVTNSVAENTVAGGVPAKTLKTLPPLT